MPANKRPKKKHRPLRVLLNPMSTLRDASTEALSPDQLRDLMITVHSSLRSIEAGHGTEEDVTHLAVASNISLILAESGLGAEYIPEVKAAQRHIVDTQERFRTTGKIGLTGPGMQAVRHMLELHDQQLEHPNATEGALRRALREIFLRCASGNYVVPGVE